MTVENRPQPRRVGAEQHRTVSAPGATPQGVNQVSSGHGRPVGTPQTKQQGSLERASNDHLGLADCQQRTTEDSEPEGARDLARWHTPIEPHRRFITAGIQDEPPNGRVWRVSPFQCRPWVMCVSIGASSPSTESARPS